MIIRKRVTVVLVICCFLLGCVKQSSSILYKKAMTIKTEASNALIRKDKDIDYALRKYEKALSIFRSIQTRYPNYKLEGVSVDGEIKECVDRISDIEAALQIRSAYFYQEKGMPEAALQTRSAYFYQEKGKPEAALKIYESVLDKYKDQPVEQARIQALIGRTYWQLSKYEDSLTAYGIVLEKYEYQPEAIEIFAFVKAGIGDTYLSMGRFPEAQSAYEQVMSEYKSSSSSRAIKSLLKLVPVESWKEIRGRYGEDGYNVIQKFFANRLTEKEFQNTFVKLKKVFENDVLFFIGLKLQLEYKFEKAKTYYQRYIVNVSNTKNPIYNLAVKALEIKE